MCRAVENNPLSQQGRSMMEKVLVQPMLTVPEVALYMRVSERSAYRIVKNCDFPAARVGKAWLTPLELLQKYMLEKASNREQIETEPMDHLHGFEVGMAKVYDNPMDRNHFEASLFMLATAYVMVKRQAHVKQLSASEHYPNSHPIYAIGYEYPVEHVREDRIDVDLNVSIVLRQTDWHEALKQARALLEGWGVEAELPKLPAGVTGGG
jgi:excisionase family DNA binding protein